jgi:hypothetical protein
VEVLLAEIGQSHILRVAAVWGTTIIDVRLLQRGQSYELDGVADFKGQIPDGSSASKMPLRAVAGGWEVDARGVVAGMMKLRGRDEEPTAMQAGPVAIVPGDYGLLQYGLYSIFFQYTLPATEMKGRMSLDALVMLALISSFVMHFGGLGLVRALMTPPPLDKPLELAGDEDSTMKWLLQRSDEEPPPPPQMSSTQDKSGGGTGVKDPGAHDPKKQGGGKKIAGAEGKAGMNDKNDHTELPGEIKPTTTYGGLSEVLNSDTGNEIRQTLKSIDSVSAALGGLNSNNIVLGSGSGTGLKGGGGGGGGTGAGVMFGSGTLDTGWGRGNGGGYGAGGGGPGGRGSGGNGNGGSGGGTGGGNGSGNGSGNGPGEHGISANAPGATANGGLSPEQINRVVRAHMGALRACYEIEAEKNPNLKGGVTVAWSIDPSGGVTSASVAGSTIHNARVEGCVARQIRAWHFPASSGVTNTGYPFVFNMAH